MNRSKSKFRRDYTFSFYRDTHSVPDKLDFDNPAYLANHNTAFVTKYRWAEN